MRRVLVAATLTIAANAIGLALAVALLDEVAADAVAFVIAVLVFSAVELAVQPLVRRAAQRWVPALAGGTALLGTLVGLALTVLVTDGLRIRGLGGWVLAAAIVWAAALLAHLALPIVLRRLIPGDEGLGPGRRAPA